VTPFSTFLDNKRVRRRFEKGAPALRKGCAGAPHSEQNTTRPVFVCCAQTGQIEKPLPPAARRSMAVMDIIPKTNGAKMPGSNKELNQAIVTYCRPWCLACGGWQAMEREYSDGSHRINCRTCGVVLEDRPLFDWPKKKRNQESTVEGV